MQQPSHASQAISSVKLIYNQFNASKSTSGVSPIDFLWSLVNFGVCKSCHDAAFVLRAALRYVDKDPTVRLSQAFDVADFALLIMSGLLPQDTITKYDVLGFEKGGRCCSFPCSLVADVVYPVQVATRDAVKFEMHHLSFHPNQSRFTIFKHGAAGKVSYSFSDFKRCELGPPPYLSIAKVRQIFAISLWGNSSADDLCIIPRVGEERFLEVAGTLVNVINFQYRLDGFKTFVSMESVDHPAVPVGSPVTISVVPRNPAGRSLLVLLDEDALTLECSITPTDGSPPITTEQPMNQALKDGMTLQASHVCRVTGEYRFTVRKGILRETVGRAVHCSVVKLRSEFVVSLDLDTIPKEPRQNEPINITIKVVDARGQVPTVKEMRRVRRRTKVMAFVGRGGSDRRTSIARARGRSVDFSVPKGPGGGDLDEIDCKLTNVATGFSLSLFPSTACLHVVRVLYRNIDINLSPLALNVGQSIDADAFIRQTTQSNFFVLPSGPQASRMRMSISAPVDEEPKPTPLDTMPDTGPSLEEMVGNLVERYAAKDPEQTLDELRALSDHLEYEIEMLQRKIESSGQME
eukprot:c20259_g1_i3.p1 GENE.c20259_g1_i3~~c20259_g1_i3.p1  ORF type:complete len:577 (+),score=101.93 c20259_g1_i3:1489-3219(+)